MPRPCLTALLLAIGALGAGAVAHAADPAAISVNPVHVFGNVFAEQDVELRVRVDAPKGWAGRLSWRLSFEGRTLAARDADVTAAAVVPLRLPIPPVKNGAALGLKLAVLVAGDGNTTAAWGTDVWAFPKDPFAGRAEWLKELKLTVFDPPGATAKALAGLNIPFADQANPAALADLTGGVLVVGEGLSFKEYPGLSAELAKAAARGVAVLVLAPADGELDVPGLDGTGPAELGFRKDIVRRLDKRLDPDGWAGAGKPVTASLAVKSSDSTAVGVVGPTGWPWAEARFPGTGRWAFCGYAVTARWDDGPAPRYFFATVLEHLAAP
ncbi:MAG: hypothetical protein ACRC7O_13725, partial [Fimbriiglobus sp.]